MAAGSREEDNNLLLQAMMVGMGLRDQMQQPKEEEPRSFLMKRGVPESEISLEICVAQDVDMQEAHQQAREHKPCPAGSISGSGALADSLCDGSRCGIN